MQEKARHHHQKKKYVPNGRKKAKTTSLVTTTKSNDMTISPIADNREIEQKMPLTLEIERGKIRFPSHIESLDTPILY